MKMHLARVEDVSAILVTLEMEYDVQNSMIIAVDAVLMQIVFLAFAFASLAITGMVTTVGLTQTQRYSKEKTDSQSIYAPSSSITCVLSGSRSHNTNVWTFRNLSTPCSFNEVLCKVLCNTHSFEGAKFVDLSMMIVDILSSAKYYSTSVNKSNE